MISIYMRYHEALDARLFTVKQWLSPGLSFRRTCRFGRQQFMQFVLSLSRRDG